MSYLVDRRVLFSGDTIALRAHGDVGPGTAHPFFRLANMDTARAKAPIRALARLENVALLCTAHTGYTTQVAQAMSAWR